MGSTYGCRKKMTQEITVTKTEDHYEMQFEGNNTAYPVPNSAIDKLDDDLLPGETDDSLTFIGEYGGHKHMKNFDVEEVVDAPGDDESNEEEVQEESTDDADEVEAEPTDQHVEEVGYHSAAGQAQQAEAQRHSAASDDDCEDSEKQIMTDGGSTHPRDFVECAECGADSEMWSKKRRLPQVGQTYECSECGHEVYVYDAGDPHETIRQFRPVTDSMATNLLFFAEVGDWPDTELEELFKQGLERAEAIDYRVVEEEGLSQSEWAEKTERRQPSVSENISKAKGKLMSEND